MPAAMIWNIEAGVLALSLVGDADDPSWQTPGGKSADQVTMADYTTAGVGVDFSCQTQSGQLVPSANTSDKVTDPTFCEPEVTTTQVGVTSYAINVTALQDPHDIDGMSYYAFKNDTKLAYFVLGLNSWGAPKCVGKCRVVAGDFGGAARTDLTTDIVLPVETKPDIQYGSDAGWVVVHGDGSPDTTGTSVAATGATEVPGAAGTWTPPASIPPASVTALQGGSVVATPTTAWGTGSYVQTGTAGVAGQAHWDGTAWTAAAAPLAAASSTSSKASAGK